MREAPAASPVNAATGPPKPDTLDDIRDKRLAILVNESAGRGTSARRGLESALAANGIEADFRFLAPDRLPDAVRGLREAGAPLVAIAGGDGTVRGAAERLAGSDTALAILPIGTLNHFARRLGLGDLERAAAALASGVTTKVAIGTANGRVFFNTATFGQYAAVVRRREELRRWLGKRLAGAAAMAGALRRLEPISVTLDVREGRIERVSPLLWLAVGRPSFSGFVRSDAPVNANELEVVITHARTRRAAAALLARGVARRLRGHTSEHDRAIEILRTHVLTLREPPVVEATLDGEIFRFAAPVSVRLVTNALRIVVPSDARYERGSRAG